MVSQRLLGVVCCLVMLGLGGQARADITFEAAVAPTRVGTSDPIRLTLSIVANEVIAHMPAPKISLKDFDVEGPQLSTSQEQYHNMTAGVSEVKYIRELNYTLYPKRTGTFVIGPARLEIAGESYLTKAVKVQVVKGSLRKAQLATQRGNRGGGSGQEATIEDNLFLLTRGNLERVYIGQQLTLDYDLFYRFQVHNVGFKEEPTYSGFWVEELYGAQRLDPHREQVDNVDFNVDLLRQVALFPTQAGTHMIEPMSLSCEIATGSSRRRSFGGFDVFMGQNTQAVVVRSQPLEIEVLPLPTQGRPENFSGAVGRFNIRVDVQPRQVAVGNPLTLKVEIGGEGHLTGIEAPDLAALQGFKIYDPKVHENINKGRGHYGGSRMYEYILIPEERGILEIPSLQFAYFNPYSETYEIDQTASLRIVAQGEMAEEEEQTFGLSRKDIQEVGQDIRYIKPDLQEASKPLVFYKSAAFWSFQVLLPLTFLALLLLQRHQQRLQGDVAYARRRRAKGEAERRLGQANQFLAQGDGKEFHAEIQRCVLAFVADQLNLSAAGLTSDICTRLLHEKGIAKDRIDELQYLLVECDLARFAAVRFTQEEMEKVRGQAEKIITDLERVL